MSIKRTLLYVLIAVAGISGSAYGQIITTIAGDGVAGHTGNGGAATSAQIIAPVCVAPSRKFEVVIGDNASSVRRVSTHGIINTIAGIPDSIGFSGDNGPATAAKMLSPFGVTYDLTGNLFIADKANNRIRRVDTSGVITTVAGCTVCLGSEGVPATNANLDFPIAVVFDRTGNMFINDFLSHSVKKINSSGIINTYAGQPGISGFAGDGGPATAAKLDRPYGLALAHDGSLLVLDMGNQRIRRIDTAGIITTLAGTGTAGYSGDGGSSLSAQFNWPNGIATDTAGNIYIADFDNHAVRKIDLTGTISTIAGTGTGGFGGDNGPATAAMLNEPASVAADRIGNIYIADYGNFRVRRITYALDTIAGMRTICAGTSVQLTDAVSGGHWTSADTLVAVADSNTGVVTGKSAGLVNITYSFGTLFQTTTVTVLPAPDAGIISGPDSICAWSPRTYIDTTPGGLWGITNVNAFVDSFGKVTGTTKGFDSVFYTVINSCGSDTAFREIFIKAYPNAGYISGKNTVCLSESAQLADTFGIALWINTNNRGSYATVSPDSILFTGLAVGLDTILAVKYTGCGNDTARKVLAIHALPDAGTITGNTTVCVNETIQLSDTLPAGKWTVFNDNAALVGTAYVTGQTPGNDTVMYKVTNVCGVDSVLWPISVFPLPEIPAITRVKNTLTIPGGYTLYLWTLNGNPIAGATDSSYTVTQEGSYWVQVANPYYCVVSSPPVTITDFECNPDEIRMFPSPASTLIMIDWCRPVNARLMCIDGKTVMYLKNINQIDISGLPNGIYQVSLSDDRGNVIKTSRITKLQ